MKRQNIPIIPEIFLMSHSNQFLSHQPAFYHPSSHSLLIIPPLQRNYCSDFYYWRLDLLFLELCTYVSIFLLRQRVRIGTDPQRPMRDIHF